jgi:hypothetical protein
MFFLTGKDGKLSVVRIGTMIVALGVLFFIVVAIAFYFNQAANRRALLVRPYPDAEQFGDSQRSETERAVYYRVIAGDTVPETVQTVVDDVAKYYDAQLKKFEDDPDLANCQRNPAAGNHLNYQPGSGKVPYEYSCLFSGSGFNAGRSTRIRIQPGIPEENTEGQVLILHEMEWSR